LPPLSFDINVQLSLEFILFWQVESFQQRKLLLHTFYAVGKKYLDNLHNRRINLSPSSDNLLSYANIYLVVSVRNFLAMQIEERNYLLFTYLYFFIAIKLKV